MINQRLGRKPAMIKQLLRMFALRYPNLTFVILILSFVLALGIVIGFVV